MSTWMRKSSILAISASVKRIRVDVTNLPRIPVRVLYILKLAEKGFEPLRPYGHQILSLKRLPVPATRPSITEGGFEPPTF